MKRVNLKHLAKELNLAVSTVSRALNDSHDIGRETKNKVLSLAKELNYEPNPYASSLRKRNSKTIAVILPEIANNFFSSAISGIEEVARQKGYHVLIYLTHENQQKEVEFSRHFLHGRVDGIIMSMTGDTTAAGHIKDLINHDIPVVFFDRICESVNTTNVTTNDYESGYSATEHLLSRGCKKICYLSFKNSSIDQKRMKGYQEALKANSIIYDDRLIIRFDNDGPENHNLLKKTLSAPERPDGIFASVEHLALLSYDVCKELKLLIPEDVKIVGFSNLRIASLLDPPLSTITQPAFEIGKEAANALFSSLKKGTISENKEIMLPSLLIERGSSR